MMTFANPLPWWTLVIALAALGGVAWFAYARVPIAPSRRYTLSALRFATLVWVLGCAMRPMGHAAATGIRDAVVPILVDSSRSMGLADVDDGRRIDAARALVERSLLPRLGSHVHVDLLRFGDRVDLVSPADLAATDRRTDLAGALAALQERYRGRPIPAVVLVSDGGDTGRVDPASAASSGPPVYAIPIGPRAAPRDREVMSVTAADSVLTNAVVDVAVTVVAHGYGVAPFTLRLLENGRSIDAREVKPIGDGIPVQTTFQVAPARNRSTTYTVEIPVAVDELVPENNARSVLVPAAGRPRRVLLVQGAAGFEHAFLRRAWTLDPSLEVDSILRKGRDESATQTFYVQAPPSRSASLLGGYPATREALFAYDVVVLANIDGDLLNSAQLEMTRAFVEQRGGGLLILGAKGFQHQALRGTAIEDVLPLELTDRSGGVELAAASPGTNRVALTPAGRAHPAMQLAATPEETALRWASLPPLASVWPLGGPRPGARVLAVTGGPGGTPRALVAEERFGAGRAIVFTGEASWRWRMMLSASDQTYERFWRQVVRWLAQSAPEPVSITTPVAIAEGESAELGITARDQSYTPRPGALIDVQVTSPSGRVDTIRAASARSESADYRAAFSAREPGVYRLTVTARQGQAVLGSAAASLLVGGVDPEMSDPRLHEDTLRRVARASGGQVISPTDVSALVSRVDASAPAAALTPRRDLWDRPWSFALLAALLSAEWLLRRTWGLR
jgi:uncharacterized membrane protein